MIPNSKIGLHNQSEKLETYALCLEQTYNFISGIGVQSQYFPKSLAKLKIKMTC